MQENVSAIRVVKAYVREKFEGEKFRKASENVRNLLMRAELILAWNAPLMQLTVYSCILLISWDRCPSSSSAPAQRPSPPAT